MIQCPTYPRSQHCEDETLPDFWLRRLEYFKHFSNFLFETERAQDATTVHIQRRDRTDWNQRPPAAMVGRTGNRCARPPGAPPDLYLGQTCHRGGDLPAPQARLLPPAHAQGDWLSAAGIRHQPGHCGQRIFGVSPAYQRHSSLSADIGATSCGPVKKRAAADVRYMPERRSPPGSSGNSVAQEDCSCGTGSAFTPGSESIVTSLKGKRGRHDDR